ncbi:MAG: hypothetical protein H6684_04735 [Deltaproteobacteria bacterium]|nr:hypothetical protein [Deltaproteobacteria bacterium]
MMRVLESARALPAQPVLRLPTLLFLASLVYLVTRLAVIVYPQDAGLTVMADELPTANVALALEQGLVMPLPLYQTKPFAAGTVYQGLLTYPLRAVFGDTLFATKLAAVIWGIATMLVWTVLAWRFFGRGAALVVATLHSLAPPFFALMSVTAWGNHHESSLPVGLALLALLAALRRRPDGPASLLSFIAGLTAGFAVYFCYTSAIAFVFFTILIALAGGGVGRLRVYLLFWAGAVLGFAPILWSAKLYGWDALGTIDTYTGYASGAMVHARDMFLENRLALSLKKFLAFWGSDLWRSFLYPRAVATGARLLAAGLLAGAAVLLVRRAAPALVTMVRDRRARTTKEDVQRLAALAILVYPLVFAAVYAASGFRIYPSFSWDAGSYAHFRYFAPVFPFVFLIIGVGLQEAWEFAGERKPLRGVVAAFATILLFFSLPYYVSLGASGPGFDAWLYRGAGKMDLIARLAAETTKHQDTFAVKLDRIRHLSEPDRAILFEQIGKISADAFQMGATLNAELPNDYWPFLARGLGYYRAETSYEPGDEKRLDEFAAKVKKSLPDANLQSSSHFAEGVGWGLSFASQEAMARLVPLVAAWNTAPEHWSTSLRVGLGRRIGSGFYIDDRLGKPDDRFYYEGVGAQIRRNVRFQCRRMDPAAVAVLESSPLRRGALIAGYLHEDRQLMGMNTHDASPNAPDS